ncbi:hypothetical protein AMATHDRAFT_44424 [Amanita thiersii Skay4041]|uniref:Uncharacterized protein n=1 Tax=Amanita thiersii Skay4041 TaxID=703135 RepID=A0A2A9P0H9_9AGAR|nr:hypothetical protein AMATHDRAFT_44424 [Amanita thiersii Skay4041]
MTTSSSTHSNPSRRPPPSLRTVITTPPWAKDEPPSPKDDTHPPFPSLPRPRPSDSVSYNSLSSQAPSRWWSFTLPRTAQHFPDPNVHLVPPRPPKHRSLSWLPSPSILKDAAPFMRKDREKLTHHGSNNDLQISIPSATAAPFTLAHTSTPGWDTPWTTRPSAQGPRRTHASHNSFDFESDFNAEDSDDAHSHLTSWQRRRKRFRAFMLANTYVPLLFRFINISFTTAALGIAIRIRQIEMRHDVMGAVGSSPTVVIIFAPLTLVHVMAAIYLEYFGRPLGLWKTSAKLAHTLSETLFICAWSAALSLSFDNFFTSVIPCASPSSISWYNQIPRSPSNLPGFESGVGERICNDQVALICLVGVGLLVYCINLIISLYRIFEKVKYHSAVPLRPS